MTPAARGWLPAVLFAVIAAAAAGYSPPPLPLRIATDTRIGYEPFYVARSTGAYDRRHIHLVELTTTGDVLQAFRNQLIDGAAITLDELLLLRAEGIDARVALVLDVSAGADALVARSGITRLAGLRGRRVGYEDTAAGAVLLASALEAASLHSRDIVPVPLTADVQVAAYRKGFVDAVVASAPTTTQLLRHGAHVLYDSRAVPGRIVDVLAVRGDIAGRRAGALRELIDGWFAAVGIVQHQPLTVAPLIARRTGVTPDEVMRQFAGVQFVDAGQNRRKPLAPASALLPTAQRLSRLMLRHHLIDREPPLTDLVDPRSMEGS